MNELYMMLQLYGADKNSPIKSEELASVLHCTTREIRKMREEHNAVKENHIKILTCNDGFYLPNSVDDIKATAKTTMRKACALFKEAHELYRVAGMEGQLKADFQDGIKEVQIHG